ncbi:MAG: single-stranded-DNA-specific exonuclease RecJ [Geminicoccaceae bacterium]
MDLGRGVLGRAWRLRQHEPATALAISQRLGLPEIVGRVLAGRGVTTETAAGFLAPRIRDWLPDPSHLNDLDRATDRIAAAVEDGERIGIIGDYDVDGASSTALVGRYLRALGVEVEIEIPERLTDGYGPNVGALDRLAAADCRLVLTLDTGTTAFAPLAHAAEQGQEVVVVDHHAAEDHLPAALAVVNPNRQDQDSPLAHLAAVGVAFVLLVAVNRELRRRGYFASRPEPNLMGLLDLVALGTVCDVVPLTGLNRAFVAQGLKVATNTAVPGLAALARCAGITSVDSARQLGFTLGPRINAGGRTGKSALGARLLMMDDAGEAAGIAAYLDELNRQRQDIERELMQVAAQAAEPQLDADRPVIVVAGEGWHIGVLGIVASRLVERCHRPVFVVGTAEGVGKGSARSIPGFDVGAAVIAAKAAGLLLHAGGHKMAAGITVATDRLTDLTGFLIERFTEFCGPATPKPASLELDGMLAVGGVTMDLARTLEQVAPFGAGNAEPAFCLQDVHVAFTKPVGDGHLSCTLVGPGGGAGVKGMAFRARGNALGVALAQGAPLRLAGKLKLDTWQGTTRPCFTIEDASPATP